VRFVSDFTTNSFRKAEKELNDKNIVNAIGVDQELQRAIEAARYLGNGTWPTEDEIRIALIECNEDCELAALMACGVPATKDNVEALKSILENVLCKSESDIEVPKPELIRAHCVLDTDFAESLKKAFDKDLVIPVKLGGKHSKGMFVAYDEEKGRTLLIKPGSGKQNPAAGMAEEDASQSNREAAFYHLSEILKINQHLPEARLVSLDGRDTAILILLPWHYKKVQELSKKDPTGIRRLFHLYLDEGMLWKWATLDYIAGNVDRHGGNIMAYGQDVQLIDHGSTMAGPSFNPGGDKYAFIPYYLRVFSGTNFKVANPKERLKAIPVASSEIDAKLHLWFRSVQAEEVMAGLYKYEIDPKPMLDRLKLIQESVEGQNFSYIINKLWCVPR
jgi:hypothetical protein